MSEKPEPDGKLSRHQVALIKPVREAKARAPRLDEMDEAAPPRDDDFEALFDNPERSLP